MDFFFSHNYSKVSRKVINDFDNILSSVIMIPKFKSNITGNERDEENHTKDKIPVLHTNRFAHIEAYAPKIFAKLRSRFGIREEDFMHSILKTGPYISFQSNSKGAKRAGSFFFFTRDGSYMVKTIKKDEAETLIKILPEYFKYMSCYAKKSLLSRFCGMYKVKLLHMSANERKKGFVDIFSQREVEENVFIITNNFFPAEASKFISERFDLKGSTIGRECSEEERINRGNNAILKDLNLSKEFSHLHRLSPTLNPLEIGLCIGPRAKSSLIVQLKQDANFLDECGVMDYSLLVGVAATFGTNNYKADRKRSSLFHSSFVKSTEKLLPYIGNKLDVIISPSLNFGKRLVGAIDSIVPIFVPLPYYGAGRCTVDCGSLSVINGKRFGQKATYYLGIIDFLQSWTLKKFFERELKRFMGYDTKAISCIHPRDYSTRFIEFLETHLN